MLMCSLSGYGLVLFLWSDPRFVLPCAGWCRLCPAQV